MTGRLPFLSVRQNPPATSTKLCKQMREFVSQRAINLCSAMSA
jgi:hypothetical protein